MRFLVRHIAVWLFISNVQSQQLVINEVSQGPSGSKEYVEFIVAGNPSCQTPVPCADLRNVVIDDNNGYFAAGSGTGIAGGALRFSNDNFWSCIPQGTLILIYNTTDLNPLIPANDASMSDNNCKLVLPVTSNLLEGQGTAPTSTVATYPTTGWTAGGGTWSMVGMANGGDSFQIRSTTASTSPTFSVSWGNNTTNAQIYFTTAATAVFSFTNQSDNDPLNQANWTNGVAGTNETPGAPNSPENASWIAGMNPYCGIANPMQVTFAVTNQSCGSSANGSITPTVTGGSAPYSYLWNTNATTATISNLTSGTYTLTVTDAGGCTVSGQATVQNSGGFTVTLTPTNESCAGACNGMISSTISGGTTPINYSWSNSGNTSIVSNLCPGTYTLIATDNAGCTATANATISAGTSPSDPTITPVGPFTTSTPVTTLTAASSGGVWSSDCGSCLNSLGQFNPSIAGVGSFQICYTTGSGSCTDADCITILVTSGCTTTDTSFTITTCPEDSFSYNGQQLPSTGSYNFTLTTSNSCDSIVHLTWNNYTVIEQNIQLSLCQGDSLFYWNQWIYQPDVIQNSTIDANGCQVTNTLTIVGEDCPEYDFVLFVPNTFTPNTDAINDTFEIIISGALVEEGFIVNRWGNVIKEFSNTDLTWDGRTQDGTLVQDGVYTWVLFYTPTGGTRKRAHGFVTVLK
jgi:gliding motility-associated-like protein